MDTKPINDVEAACVAAIAVSHDLESLYMLTEMEPRDEYQNALVTVAMRLPVNVARLQRHIELTHVREQLANANEDPSQFGEGSYESYTWGTYDMGWKACHMLYMLAEYDFGDLMTDDKRVRTTTEAAIVGNLDRVCSGLLRVIVKPIDSAALRVQVEKEYRRAEKSNATTNATPNGTEATTKVTWQQAANIMEGCRLNGEPFTSQDKFATRIGCAKATVNKAIHSTVELKDWAEKQVTSTLNAVYGPTLKGIASTREADPTDICEDDDVDAMMAYLLDQAEPDERARINEMSPADKRRLAQTAYRDPDGEEQAARYRRPKPKLIE